jgi:hypothetical protein
VLELKAEDLKSLLGDMGELFGAVIKEIDEEIQKQKK